MDKMEDKITRRTNEAAREALASILLYQIKDPRLDFATISGVDVSRDRSVARVYISAERGHEDEVAEGLESAKGRMRSLLGAELGWRMTPELRFAIDTTLDEAERIANALKEVPPTLSVEKDEWGYPLASE
jgi:ribosome-binding factor A